MNVVLTALGVFLNDLPYFALAMFLMWDHVRYSRRFAMGLMILITVLHAVSIMSLMTFYADWIKVTVPHEIGFMVLYLAAFVWAVKLRPTRLMFMAFFIKFYADLITSYAAYIELSMYPHESASSFSAPFIIIHLALLCVTWPLMFWFIKKQLRELYLVESSIWRFIWVLPAAFYGLHTLYTQQKTAAIYTWNYLIFSAVMFLSSLLVYALILETLKIARDKARLEVDVTVMSRQLDLQRSEYRRMSEHIEYTKALRHDLRHQFAVLRDMSASGNSESLNAYIDELAGVIYAPAEKEYCKNIAVNSVVRYYLSAAERDGVNVNARLDIPEESGNVPAMDLCIVFGNLLENALEACRRSNGDRFIRAIAKTQGKHLSVIIENSFDGTWSKQNGEYVSYKSDSVTTRIGIGLSSVKAVCEKYDGMFVLAQDANVWRSSALVDFESSGDKNTALISKR
ncbi:MAG: GHKL domain-containing protein [Oscillospiraceae bacterium]|jgi:signal transduction histidine kinase|nr:GHKL domain-containing protein [Oscillospiraceae bacterium]